MTTERHSLICTFHHVYIYCYIEVFGRYFSASYYFVMREDGIQIERMYIIILIAILACIQHHIIHD